MIMIDKTYDELVEFTIVMPSLNPKLSSIIKTIDTILLNEGKYEIVVVLQKTLKNKIESLNNRYSDNINVNFISDNGLGISRARNIAIRKSVGTWMLLLDDDVIVDSDLIGVLGENINYTNKFYYGNILITGTEKPFLRFATKKNKLDYFSYNRICSVGLIIHKDVFARIGFFDEKLGAGTIYGSSEESDFILRALLSNMKIRYMPSYTIYHDEPCPNENKIISYAMGAGALYKKYLFKGNLTLDAKLIIDLVIRCLLLLTLSKKRYIFLKGFFMGFRRLNEGASTK